MVVPWLLSTIPVLLVLASVVNAEVKLYINTTTDIPTECKTCPRSLCPNKVAYNWEENFNVTCWTRGTKIVDDRLWLKSGDGCYVTQWDLIEYAGDCKFFLLARWVRLMTSTRHTRSRILWCGVRRTAPDHRGRDSQVQDRMQDMPHPQLWCCSIFARKNGSGAHMLDARRPNNYRRPVRHFHLANMYTHN
jgi:hypothetical protein